MTQQNADAVLTKYLAASDLPYEQVSHDTFVITLPGEHKLQTNMSLTLGTHAITINAFVSRNPDENHEAVYRWLLERNRRMYAVTFAIDHLGDIYLTGRLPLDSITADELDRVFGSVLEYSDGAFNTILELGFASAIKREWAWRISRGESTANLAAFSHLAEADQATDSN
ncbi:MAG: YbjN domain-containing protein [Actinomycetota bacterium]|nr:YbjN domain-containing protein [Actinomycetota bacterium]